MSTKTSCNYEVLSDPWYLSIRGSCLSAVLSAASAMRPRCVASFSSRSEDLVRLECLLGGGHATFQAVFSQPCSLLLDALCHACCVPQEGVFLPSYPSLLCGCCGLTWLWAALVAASSTHILLGDLLCTYLPPKEDENGQLAELDLRCC